MKQPILRETDKADTPPSTLAHARALRSQLWQLSHRPAPSRSGESPL